MNLEKSISSYNKIFLLSNFINNVYPLFYQRKKLNVCYKWTRKFYKLLFGNRFVLLILKKLQ